MLIVVFAVSEKFTITDTDGKLVWDLEQYKKYIKQKESALYSVNPSLWRNG